MHFIISSAFDTLTRFQFYPALESRTVVLVSFIGTGFREIALKVKRQRTRIALRHERRLLQKSEINLGREGTTQAANFPELRNEIVALKKLEQEQKEVALRIAQIEEGIKKSRRNGNKMHATNMRLLQSWKRKKSRSCTDAIKRRTAQMSANAN